VWRPLSALGALLLLGRLVSFAQKNSVKIGLSEYGAGAPSSGGEGSGHGLDDGTWTAACARRRHRHRRFKPERAGRVEERVERHALRRYVVDGYSATVVGACASPRRP
jgi:hypothetical protein